MDLKAIGKKLRINGQVKNFSSKTLWVLETDSGKAIAHLLSPMMKSPTNVDADAFKREDGVAIEGHSSWWKFYDFSTVEIIDKGKGIAVSVITKTAVDDKKFNSDGTVIYDATKGWGVPIQLITNVKRDRKKNIKAYLVGGVGWVDKDVALTMVCHGQIDNARPVFPASGDPYIRTRRDRALFNNLDLMG